MQSQSRELGLCCTPEDFNFSFVRKERDKNLRAPGFPVSVSVVLSFSDKGHYQDCCA